MEKSERRSKREERKERRKNPKLEWTGGNRGKGFHHSEDDAVASPSPRGVFEVPISGTDSDSTGSSNYGVTPPPQRPSHVREGGQQWKAMIEALKFKSVRRFSSIPLLAASYEMSRRSLRNKLARIRTAPVDDENDCEIDLDAIPTKASWKNFSYADLVAATDDFNPGKNEIKHGHFSSSIKCILSNSFLERFLSTVSPNLTYNYTFIQCYQQDTIVAQWIIKKDLIKLNIISIW